MSSRIKVPLTPSRLAVSPVLAVPRGWNTSNTACCDAFEQSDPVAQTTHVRLFSFTMAGGALSFQEILDTSVLPSTSSSKQVKPQVHGNRDNWVLVWEDNRTGTRGVYGYRSGGSEFRISSGPDSGNPAISDDLVAWEDYGSDANGDIRAYSLSRKVELSVAAGPTSQHNPRVYGNRVVWEENVDGMWGVYTAVVQWPEATPTPPPTETATPASTLTIAPTPTETPTPTSTSTSISTPTETPTSTSTPTATASPTPPPTSVPGAVSIRFSPSEVTVNPGNYVDLDIVIEAGSQPFNGAQAYLAFPAAALQVAPHSTSPTKWLRPGAALPQEVARANEADNAAGQASYAAVVFDTTVTGSAVLGTVRFKTSAAGDHSVTFQFDTGNGAGNPATPMRYTKVTGPDGTDLLQSRAMGAVIHVPAPAATATSTAAPVATATLAIVATGTAVPTIAPTNTPEPTTMATETPEATATPHPTGTPTFAPTATVQPTPFPIPTEAAATAVPPLLLTEMVPSATPARLIQAIPISSDLPNGLPSMADGGFVALLPAIGGTGIMDAGLGGSPVEIRVLTSGDRELAILFQPLPASDPGLQSHAQGNVVLAFRLDVYSYDPATNSVEKWGDETSGPIRLQIGITDALWRSCEGNPGRLALFRLAHEWPNAGSLERIPTFNSSSPWSPSPPLGSADLARATYGALNATFENRSVFRLVVLPPPENDGRYFKETGFRVNKDSFWDYFNRRGGIKTFGYPVSREFHFNGFEVQFFQRAVLQSTPDGGVALLNLLDTGLLPYTRMNYSAFPPPDPDLIAAAPSPSDPDYAARALAFIAANVPNSWNGLNVGFLAAFNNTVTYQDAFPNGDGDEGLLPLLNLEIWGLPTGKPACDPSNSAFVYQRFQRGILHYDATAGTTQGLLVADYLKAVITGKNLPDDLDEQARGSKLYKQYDASSLLWLARPEQLPGTNLMGAFEPGP